jgi:hypothetical protein
MGRWHLWTRRRFSPVRGLPSWPGDDSKNVDHPGEQEAQKQGSDTAIKQMTCLGCQRIFGSEQGLASHLKDSY